MLISQAFAQDAGGGGAAGLLGSPIIMMVLIFVVFYFLMIRPQQKKMKAMREMIGAVKRGDRVITSGGIIGQVIKVINENEVNVQIAEGVRVRMLRSNITDVIAKDQPIKGEARGKDEEIAEEDKPMLPPPSAVQRPAGLAGLFGLGKPKN
ncbi:MAG: preprotein translocase subunit YajC [Rhodospirillales bacterium]